MIDQWPQAIHVEIQKAHRRAVYLDNQTNFGRLIFPIGLIHTCSLLAAGFRSRRIFLAASIMWRLLIPYLSSNASGGPDRGISRTASLTTLARSPTALRTASPRPPSS